MQTSPLVVEGTGARYRLCVRNYGFETSVKLQNCVFSNAFIL